MSGHVVFNGSVATGVTTSVRVDADTTRIGVAIQSGTTVASHIQWWLAPVMPNGSGFHAATAVAYATGGILNGTRNSAVYDKFNPGTSTLYILNTDIIQHDVTAIVYAKGD